MITSIKSSMVAFCHSVSICMHSELDMGPGGKLATIFISDQDFTVENLVVSKDTGDHLLVEVLRGRLESDFLASSLLEFKVDIPGTRLTNAHTITSEYQDNSRRILVQSNPNGIQFILQQCLLLSTFCSIEHHENQITSLQ